jgi:hypothetical protein
MVILYKCITGGFMADDPIVAARKKAERAVEDMTDPTLKVAAFQTILSKLLTEAGTSSERTARPSPRSGPSLAKSPDTTAGRILSIKSEDFFKTQKTLGEVREALRSHGWHYPLSALSGIMQGLVRRRQLRRERMTVGGKSVWKYSEP